MFDFISMLITQYNTWRAMRAEAEGENIWLAQQQASFDQQRGHNGYDR